MTIYDIFKKHHLQGHTSMIAEIQELMDRQLKQSFDAGVDEGRAAQAILELQGRAKFLATLNQSRTIQ